jgi:predicted secreted Zn-dependent protease
MRAAFMLVAAAVVALPSSALAGEASVKVKAYPISGSTGFELFQSIGENGPNGGAHVAHTDPKLVWKRLFDERGGSCYLVHACPQVSFVQIYPKPSGRLSGSTRAVWDKFIAAVRKHEDTHVRMFRQMVVETEASLAGMFEPDDRTCAKIKASVQAKLEEAQQAYRARSRAFDRAELGPQGPLSEVLRDLMADR